MFATGGASEMAKEKCVQLKKKNALQMSTNMCMQKKSHPYTTKLNVPIY